MQGLIFDFAGHYDGNTIPRRPSESGSLTLSDAVGLVSTAGQRSIRRRIWLVIRPEWVAIFKFSHPFAMTHEFDFRHSEFARIHTY